MRRLTLIALVVALHSAAVANAQSGDRRWETIADLPLFRAGYVHFHSDSTIIVASGDPSLLVLDANGERPPVSISLDSVPRPYILYPSGDVKSILSINDSIIWVGMFSGHLFEVNIASGQRSVIGVGPSRQMAGRPEGVVLVGFFRTSDTGRTWVDAILPLDLKYIIYAAAGSHKNELFAASDSTRLCLHRSGDGGDTWEAIGGRCIGQFEMTSARTIVAFPDGSLLVEATKKNFKGDLLDFGIFRYDVSDSTWSRALTDSIEPFPLIAVEGEHAVVVFSRSSGAEANRAFESYDAGRTWREISNGLPGTEIGGISGLAIRNGRVIAAFDFDPQLYELRGTSSVDESPVRSHRLDLSESSTGTP